MNGEIFRIARETKERLAAVVPVLEVRVYGSRARNEAAADSDLDLFVVVEELDRVRKDRALDVCWEIGFAHGLVISPLLVTRAELYDTPLRSAPIIENIRREGVAV